MENWLGFLSCAEIIVAVAVMILIAKERNLIQFERRFKLKYGNKKTVVDGIKFDSKLEANRYRELKLLEKAGAIKGLELQPKFRLIPTFRKNGKTYRGITYIADFAYYDENERYIVEDVKGYKTKEYQIKRKLFEYTFPDYTLTEVMK